MPPQLLTVADVSRITRLSEQTVRRLTREGKLPCVPSLTQRKRLYHPEAIAAALRNEPQTPAA
jgi:hypothetical protein